MSETIGRRQFVARTGGLVVTSGLMGAVLDACGSGGGSTTTAKVGGSLDVFVYAGYDDKKAEAPFLKKYGVRVNTTNIDQPDGIITRLKAGGTSQFDLVSANVAQAPMMVAADVVQPIDYSRLPNTKQLLSNMAPLGTKTFGVGGKSYAVPYVWGINALVYNSKLVPSKPTSWKDLLTAPYKGKLAMTDAAGDNIIIWGRMLGFDPTTMTKDQLNQTIDYIINIKKQQARTFSNNFDDLADQLARGDVWAVASPVWIALIPLAGKKGADGKSVTWTLPKEGGGTWTDAFYIPKSARNVDTAYAWLDWMLSARAQATVAADLNSGTVNRDAVPLLTTSMRATYPYGSVNTLARTAPIEAFPTGPATYADWVAGWTRVQAA